MDKSIVSELLDISSPVNDEAENLEPLTIELKGNDVEPGEDDEFVENSTEKHEISVAVTKEENILVGTEGHLNFNLVPDGNVVLEDSSNVNDQVIEKDCGVETAVLEGDSELRCELLDEEKKGVLAGEIVGEESQVMAHEVVPEGREVEAKDDEGEQNGVNQTINQAEDTNPVKEATPSTHGEETAVLPDDCDIIDANKEVDINGEFEKIGNYTEEEEYDEDGENDESMVLGDGDGDADGSGFPNLEKENVVERKGQKSEDSDDDDNEEDTNNNIEDKHISEYIYHCNSLKESILEIHVGGLHKAAVEDDLIKVFAKFGEIQELKISRNPHTKKSKGFGFIRFVTVKHAKNALLELKDGIEVRGKLARVSASQGNHTLYMGNIRKSWRKEKVLETLRGFEIPQIQDIHLPEDPEKDGKIKGFAFLRFSSHNDAMEAYQKLRKPDAIFGCASSAKVAFTPTASEEVLSQIKTVYVEGLPLSWNDEKVKDICKQYGEIEIVKLSWDLVRKRKYFGFITFTSRESALACVEGMNSFRIGEGEVEIKVNMSKSLAKGRLQIMTGGGFKVEKNRHNGEETGHTKSLEIAKSRETEKKRKELAKNKGKASLNSERGKRVNSNKHQSIVSQGEKNGTPSRKRRNSKRKNIPSKPDGHDRGSREMDRGYSKRPLKKSRGDIRGRLNSKDRAVYASGSAAYSTAYTSRYDVSASSCPRQAYGPSSGSKRHHSDMEPHAGFLETATKGKRQPHSRHVKLAIGQSYVEPPVRKSYPYEDHVESYLSRQVRHRVDYVEPVPLTQNQPRARYLVPAVENQTLGPYEYDTRRVSRYDGQGIRSTAYVGGSAVPPSYVSNYTSYARLQSGGSSVGNYYQTTRSTAAQLPRRTYY